MTPDSVLPSDRPVPGDVISMRYRWSHEDKDEVGKKIRPCIVVQSAPDGSAMIVVPTSTREGWAAKDCIEIVGDEARKTAGVDLGLRSWAKLTEVNRVDLPNAAVIPHTDPEGRMVWRRGRISDEMLKDLQREIGIRINDKSLQGVRIASDVERNQGLRIEGFRVIRRAGEPEIEPPSAPPAPNQESDRLPPGAPRPDRTELHRQLARERIAREASSRPDQPSSKRHDRVSAGDERD